jgi:hypothetical protein
MAFQAHLIMSIKKERSFTQATRVAWEVTERLRAEGHEAYVVAVDKIGSAPKRRRSRGASSPSKHKAEAAQS